MRLLLTSIVSIFFQSLFSQVGTYEVVYEFEIISKVKNPDLSILPEILPGDELTCYFGDKDMKAVLTNEGKEVLNYYYSSENSALYEMRGSKKYGVIFLADKSVSSTLEKTGKYDVVADKRCYVGNDGDEPKVELKYSPEVKIKFDLPFYDYSNSQNFWLLATERQIIMEKKFEFPTFYLIQRAKKITPLAKEKADLLVPEMEFYYSQESVDQPFELTDPSSTFDCLFKKIKKPKELNEEVTVYVEFILESDGNIKYIDSFTPVAYDLHKKTVKAFTGCKPKLKPATINNQSVSSLCYFPVKIRPDKD